MILFKKVKIKSSNKMEKNIIKDLFLLITLSEQPTREMCTLSRVVTFKIP